MQLEDFFLNCATQCEEYIYNNYNDLLNIENKSSKTFDPVTQADRAIEKILKYNIKENFPNHGIIGEEFGTESPNAEYVWILDPIDGTRNFLTGLLGWGCLVGLFKDQKPFASMILQPITSERFIATQKQAKLIWGNGRFPNKQLNVSKTTDLNDALLHISTDITFKEVGQKQFYDELENSVRLLRTHHDCYAYAMLASGKIDICVDLGLKIYDIAALIPLIENAGGHVIYWVMDEKQQNYGIIASCSKEIEKSAVKLFAQAEILTDIENQNLNNASHIIF